MSTVLRTSDIANKEIVSTINQDQTSKKGSKNDNKKTKSNKLKLILLILLGVALIAAIIVAIHIIINKNKKKKNGRILKNEENGKNKEIPNNKENGKSKPKEEVKKAPFFFSELSENNYNKTKEYNDSEILPDRRIKDIGEDFQRKNNKFISGRKNKTFIIDGNGNIK